MEGENNFEFNSFYTNVNSPVVLTSYAEVKFIEAGSHMMRATPDEVAVKRALNEALAASFEKITGSSVPAAHQAEVDVAWAKAEVLINEKYIVCYLQSLLAWNDYWRTGYPALTIVSNGVNLFNANGQIPQQLLTCRPVSGGMSSETLSKSNAQKKFFALPYWEVFVSVALSELKVGNNVFNISTLG